MRSKACVTQKEARTEARTVSSQRIGRRPGSASCAEWPSPRSPMTSPASSPTAPSSTATTTAAAAPTSAPPAPRRPSASSSGCPSQADISAQPLGLRALHAEAMHTCVRSAPMSSCRLGEEDHRCRAEPMCSSLWTVFQILKTRARENVPPNMPSRDSPLFSQFDGGAQIKVTRGVPTAQSASTSRIALRHATAT